MDILTVGAIAAMLLTWIIVAGVLLRTNSRAATEHAEERQLLMNTWEAERIRHAEERRELYARIQAYVMPDQSATTAPNIRGDDVPHPEIHLQLKEDGYYDPLTKKIFPTSEEAIQWRQFLSREGKPFTFTPEGSEI